ncbi:MAG: hypothetical protein E7461_04350 [Ruminococcaceae bacterium]|nr:hypothetical protein [Oscillospiraceae bacterium]
MEKLQFDSGVRVFRVNGGEKLCFNPSDPNLYARLEATAEELSKLQREMTGENVPQMLQKTDRQLKKLLGEIFPGNDMEKIFGGVNLLSPTATGKCVFENFMAALSPILARGAEECAKRLMELQDAK